MTKIKKRKSTTSISPNRLEKKLKKSRRQQQINDDNKNDDESLNIHRLGPEPIST
ncbi:unnamed protein product, partial [Rotaria sordida]